MMFRSNKNVCPPAGSPRPRAHQLRAATAASLIALLSACGGGGGGGGSTTSTPVVPVVPPTTTPTTPGVTTYSLLAGFRKLIQSGSVDNFTVAGDCSGTARTSNGAAVPATFNSTPGYSTAEDATLSLTSCTTVVTQSTGTNFYDANFALIGTTNTAGAYSQSAAALPLPATVKVGDSAPTYNIYVSYTDSTKTTRSGQVVEGYSIDADSASTSTTPTAIYHVTSKSYDNAGTLLSTQQTFYRMAVDGTLSLLSLDLVYSGALFASHLVYTRIN